MGVTEVSMALGQWSVQLRKDTPRAVLDALGYFGHVALTTGRVQPALLGDGLLKAARYVGVLTGVTRTDTTAPVTLSGPGMAFWLGDANDKGSVYETPVNLVAQTFAASITALLPSSGAVTAGTIGSVPGTLTQSYVWTSPRTAITSVCQLMGGTGTSAAEWRVNGDATIDAGTVASLYVTTPVAALVRKNTGADQTVRAMHGVMQNAGDVNDYSTRAVVLAAGSSGSTAVGSANAAVVPYKDLHGNTVKLTRMASQSSTDPTNAAAAAAAVLALYNSARNALILSTDEFDLKGTVSVGDYVWVQDPDSGLVDYTQEIHLRGEVLTPVLMRVVELDWPVLAGYGAAYRDQNGVWTDLTDYLIPEAGVTNVVVGSTNRPLTGGGESVGTRPIPDPTVPATPVFGAFSTTSYQGPSDGKTKAQIQVAWSTPLNTDGSTVIDGDHYEVQYRPDLGVFAVNPSYNALQSAGYTYNTLAALGGSYNQLVPQAVANWKVTFVAWGTNTVLIQELTPGVNYDFQIRAVDTASPPNQSAWSATTTFQAAVDTIAPQTPDAPSVAANMASVQISWDCGSATGGTFNQAVDLHHIEVHGSYDPLFVPSNATKLGNVVANVGNITGQIPVVASFTLPPNQPPAQQMYIKIIAVDVTGNKSQPSAAAGASAVLWSNAYITDLSVSKLTAGTVTASIVLAGTIATASSGQRVQMDSTGLRAFDANGNQIFSLSDSSPVIILGTNGTSGNSVKIDTSQTYPTVAWNVVGSTTPAFINAINQGGGVTGLGINMGHYTSGLDGSAATQQIFLQGSGGIFLTCNDTTGIQNGSGLILSDLNASVSFANHGNPINGGIFFELNGGFTDTAVTIEGYTSTFSTDSGGFVTYTFNSFSAGGGTFAISYGVTMLSHMSPVLQYSCSNTTVTPSLNVSANSTTGYSVTMSAAAPASFSIFTSSFRSV